MRDVDPRCPHCDGKIGMSATYCMHCSADLTDELAGADGDGDGWWDRIGGATTISRRGAGAGAADPRSAGAGATADPVGVGRGSVRLLDPDGLVDNSLTVVVGIAGGVVVGFVGTIVLGALTGSAWALLFGFVAWLVATAYLVRRRTVQEAVAKCGYAVAAVLLAVPLVALSPVVNVTGGPGERVSLFVFLSISVAIPAGIAAAAGWVASQFVPDGERGSEG